MTANGVGRVIDISPVIGATLAVFPGDTPMTSAAVCSRAAGASVNLSRIAGTVHAGAHADAPWHYDDGGLTIDRVPLDAYWGQAVVVRVPAAAREQVGVDALSERLEVAGPPPLRGAWRLLMWTGTYGDPTRWTDQFAAFDPASLEWLAGRGCVLVGLDTPSVDLEDSKDLPAHGALARTKMANLEGLVLGHVAEGWYELVALPLKLEGLDGSPVRAALRDLK